MSFSAVYFCGRSRTFGSGDSPEYVLSAIVWGVPHSPGYPLYVMLGHVFSRMPFGSPAANVNGLSGIFSAFALALFFLALRRLGCGAPAGLAASLWMGLSPLFWYFSLIGEARALNHVLALAAFNCALSCKNTVALGPFALFGACLGLGLGHHQSFVTVAPALLYLLFCGGERRPSCRQAFCAALAAACAFLAPYVALALRCRWGHPLYNPFFVHTLRGVTGLILRSQYGGPFHLVAGRSLLSAGHLDLWRFWEHQGYFVSACWQDLMLPGLALAALGAWHLWSGRRPLLYSLSLWAILPTFAITLLSSQQMFMPEIEYQRAVIVRQLLLPQIGLFVLLGFALERLLSRVRPALAWAVVAVSALPLLLRPVSMKGRDLLWDYSRQILQDSGPADMLLLSSDDSVVAMQYQDIVERGVGGRVLLIPNEFNSSDYISDLKRRHPDLHCPVAGNGLSLDWGRWVRLNPGRRLLAEASYAPSLLRELPNSSPHGVLIEASRRSCSIHEAEARARKFLNSRALSGLLRRGVLAYTQEVYLARTYAELLRWYGWLLKSSRDQGLKAGLEGQLRELLAQNRYLNPPNGS